MISGGDRKRRAVISEECSCERLGPDLIRVRVPNVANPGGQATNVYIAGTSPALLIDAGSDDGGRRVMRALAHFGIASIERIILTHAHQDHAGAAPAIRAALGAEIFIHPRELSDPAYQPVKLGPVNPLREGDAIDAGSFCLCVIETPGHAPGHVSLYDPERRALFSGDLVSGQGTVAVVPPRGSMSAYLASLRRVAQLEIDVIYPGHGPVITAPQERIERYIDRRQSREREIYDAVASGLATSSAIADRLYPDVVPRFRRAAEGTVRAHLLHLVEQGLIRVDGASSDGELRYVCA